MTEDPLPTHRRRRGTRIVVVVLLLLVVLLAVASRIQLNYYALSPGQAQPVAPLIHVPPARAHRVHGALLLTDVYLSQISLLEWIPDQLSSDTDVVPADELLSPATPADQLTDQGYVEMQQAKDAAKAAALRRLGYPVPERDAGAQVFSVEPGSPAAAASVGVGDVVTAVGTTPTPTACAFVGALAPYRPGQVVPFRVERASISPSGAIRTAAARPVPIRLGRPRGGATGSACPGQHGPSPVFVGVSIETSQEFRFPFPVSVDTTDIGGPSAGLAMTLGIIDKLSDGRLTGHHIVAATGTIDDVGDVGDVGGVPQKTVAVERAGATVFFVPPEELVAARSKAIPSLHVYAVATLSQALAQLQRLGGEVPPAPATGGGA